jgi:ribosomal protein L37AE/L43A
LAQKWRRTGASGAALLPSPAGKNAMSAIVEAKTAELERCPECGAPLFELWPGIWLCRQVGLAHETIFRNEVNYETR